MERSSEQERGLAQENQAFGIEVMASRWTIQVSSTSGVSNSSSNGDDQGGWHGTPSILRAIVCDRPGPDSVAQVVDSAVRHPAPRSRPAAGPPEVPAIRVKIASQTNFIESYRFSPGTPVTALWRVF
jgi:hypothetical protein